jgi:hypothetical protein
VVAVRDHICSHSIGFDRDRSRSKDVILKVQKKPIIVDAFYWRGTTHAELELRAWLAGVPHIQEKYLNDGGVIVTEDRRLDIRTEEGQSMAEIGDYVIVGIKGEVYPIKPDIFRETYTIV